jgi:hypothetical protein
MVSYWNKILSKRLEPTQATTIFNPYGLHNIESYSTMHNEQRKVDKNKKLKIKIALTWRIGDT